MPDNSFIRNDIFEKDNLNKEIISKLQLREEQLDIVKNWVQTGEVNVHREVITVEKTFTVPITREELIIEKKIISDNSSKREEENVEVIRIPVKEERVEIVKHPVILEEVDIYKRDYQENQHIEQILRKEKLNVETDGNAIVIDNGLESNF